MSRVLAVWLIVSCALPAWAQQVGLPVDAGVSDAATSGADAAMPTPPAATTPAPTPPAPPQGLTAEVRARLDELDELKRRQAAEHVARIAEAKRRRLSAILTTSFGIAFQLAGIFELSVGLSTAPSPVYGFTAVGSPQFIDTMIGLPLSIIGVVMWPVGTAKWVAAEKDLTRLRSSDR